MNSTKDTSFRRRAGLSPPPVWLPRVRDYLSDGSPRRARRLTEKCGISMKDTEITNYLKIEDLLPTITRQDANLAANPSPDRK